MAQLIEDNNIARVTAALSRLRGQLTLHDEWAGQPTSLASYQVDSVLSRVTASMTMPGKALWDTEPIVFDDLIEVRTGGDKALGILLEPTLRVPAQLAMMQPLRLKPFEDAVNDELEPFFYDLREERHVVILSAGSPLEEIASVQWGYAPVASLRGMGANGGMRYYAPNHLWLRLRDEFMTARAEQPEANLASWARPTITPPRDYSTRDYEIPLQRTTGNLPPNIASMIDTMSNTLNDSLVERFSRTTIPPILRDEESGWTYQLDVGVVDDEPEPYDEYEDDYIDDEEE